MKEWDEIWKTEEGRSWWLEPESFVVGLLPRFKNEGLKKVLDLGFGLGRHSILLAKEGFEVYGIDTSPAGLQFALQWAEREDVTLDLALGDMGQLPYASDFFDLILAWAVIYHGTVEYIRRTVAEMERCLRPGGYLLCSLISTRNDQCGLGEEIEKGTYVIFEDEEKSYPHHYFDREEIETLLGGFTLLECEDVAGGRPGSWHWHILARAPQAGQGSALSRVLSRVEACPEHSRRGQAEGRSEGCRSDRMMKAWVQTQKLANGPCHHGDTVDMEFRTAENQACE